MRDEGQLAYVASRMLSADVIVLALPVCCYTWNAQIDVPR